MEGDQSGHGAARGHALAAFQGMTAAGTLTVLGTAAATAGAAGAFIRKHAYSGRPVFSLVLPATIVLLTVCGAVEEAFLKRSGISDWPTLSREAAVDLQLAGVVSGLGVFIGGVGGASLSRMHSERLILPWLVAIGTALAALDWGIVRTVRAARAGHGAGAASTSTPMPGTELCTADGRDNAYFGMGICATGTGLGILISVSALLRSWYHCARVKTVTAVSLATAALIAVFGRESAEAIREAEASAQAILGGQRLGGALPPVVGFGLKYAGVVAAVAYMAPGVLVAAAAASLSRTTGRWNSVNMHADAVALAIVCLGVLAVALFGRSLSAMLVACVSSHLAGTVCVVEQSAWGHAREETDRSLTVLGLMTATAGLALFAAWATVPPPGAMRASLALPVPGAMDDDLESTQLTQLSVDGPTRASSYSQEAAVARAASCRSASHDGEQFAAEDVPGGAPQPSPGAEPTSPGAAESVSGRREAATPALPRRRSASGCTEASSGGATPSAAGASADRAAPTDSGYVSDMSSDSRAATTDEGRTPAFGSTKEVVARVRT